MVGLLDLLMTTHASSCSDAAWNFSQTTVGVEKFISKLKSSYRNGKIDLLWISVWDGTESYYSQQIVAWPSSKRFVKALRIGFS